MSALLKSLGFFISATMLKKLGAPAKEKMMLDRAPTAAGKAGLPTRTISGDQSPVAGAALGRS